MNRESKWIALSLTLWGTLITAFSALAPALGIDMTPEALADISQGGVSIINAAGVIVGSALTIVGRFRASTRTTLLPRPGGGSRVGSPAAAVLLAIGLSLALTGCGFRFIPGGAGIESGEGAPEASPQQELADRILGEVDGLEARSIRVRFIAAAYSELAMERVTTTDPGAAAEVLGNLDRLQLAVERFDKDDYDPIFLETDMRRAARLLVGVLYDSAAGAVRADLVGLVDGIDIGKVRERISLRASQLYLSLGLQADIRRSLKALGDGELQAAAIRAAIDKRIKDNRARILAMTG